MRQLIVKFIVELQAGVPETEFSKWFVQGMAARMAMSFFKYGRVAEGFPARVDAVKTLKDKLEQYERTGNAEWLMDVANYAMIEAMHPRHPKAHFQATDTSASRGRFWHGEVDPIHDSNKL